MADLVDELCETLGTGSVLRAPDAQAIGGNAWGRLGMPLALLRPRTTEEVSQILRAAHEAGQQVVPWGGRTGLVDGCHAEGALALSLERMNAIRRSIRTTPPCASRPAACFRRPARRRRRKACFCRWIWAPAAPPRSAARSRPMPAATV